MPHRGEMVKKSICFPAEMWHLLKERSEKTGLSISYLVREPVGESLEIPQERRHKGDPDD